MSDHDDRQRPTSTTLRAADGLLPRPRPSVILRDHPAGEFASWGSPVERSRHACRAIPEDSTGDSTELQHGHISHEQHRMVEANRVATRVDIGPPGLEPFSPRRGSVRPRPGRRRWGLRGWSPFPAPLPRPVQPAPSLPALRRMRPGRPVAAAVFRRSRQRAVEVVVAEVPGLVRADQLPAPTARDDPQDDLLLPALTISTMNLPVASSHRLPRPPGLTHDRLCLSGGDIPDGSGVVNGPRSRARGSPLPWSHQPGPISPRYGGTTVRVQAGPYQPQ